MELCGLCLLSIPITSSQLLKSIVNKEYGSVIYLRSRTSWFLRCRTLLERRSCARSDLKRWKCSLFLDTTCIYCWAVRSWHRLQRIPLFQGFFYFVCVKNIFWDTKRGRDCRSRLPKSPESILSVINMDFKPQTSACFKNTKGWFNRTTCLAWFYWITRSASCIILYI